ncbi:MAG TPA: hypothetical protein VIY52_00450 [Streptosporangiaceae bacterium]
MRQIRQRQEEVLGDMKNYKFQALVTLYPVGDADPYARLGPAPRRMVLRATNSESKRSQVFNALISSDEDGPLRPGNPRVIVTLRLAGDDIADYLRIGGHFDLWFGDDIGQGVVTHRLFV